MDVEKGKVVQLRHKESYDGGFMEHYYDPKSEVNVIVLEVLQGFVPWILGVETSETAKSTDYDRRIPEIMWYNMNAWTIVEY